jgi:glycosyltransferase involved in cell wall biosynthesis
MIFYLSYNDQPSGIYVSQVNDVVNFLSRELGADVRLLAFISARNFIKNRRRIRQHTAGAIVLPMVPGIQRWKRNSAVLNAYLTFFTPSMIIARSVLATQLAFKTHCNKIVYDGRGAIAAEWKEYKVVEDPSLIADIHELERQAVMNSDFRIAVSNELVAYWSKEFNYKENKHVIIPCTIGQAFEKLDFDADYALTARKTLGFLENETVFCYAGSLAGWQSFKLLYDFLKPLLEAELNAKVLFLSDNDANIERLKEQFPSRISCAKAEPDEVPFYLSACDFGLLIRETSVTNKVASPVKFAEYLSCGLKVIISQNLGDYSDLVRDKGLGWLYKDYVFKGRPSMIEKSEVRKYAMLNFTKRSQISNYERLVAI